MFNKLPSKLSLLIASISLAILAGCATYYQKTQKFQDFITTGEIDKANNWLNGQKKNSKQTLNFIQ